MSIWVPTLGYLSGEPLIAFKGWFIAYTEWMTTHDFGIAERDSGNNHSTCWAVQVGSFASPYYGWMNSNLILSWDSLPSSFIEL